ncbi:glycosyltransferase family 2 protein [Gemmata sp. JC717]|uniref:Glycosyltransferase family 2 protein n=1 Tax=Gemmata algarum TaxID=2975278 RepID=A0ABU5F962_9BACT|nr:glycosyltransferase family 2 protein [Gemmata algarum]MDY3555174.1 glycosyltransferase family 2 protein [Gemmata algarum]MDY3563648.1 glycosyltransferase family 2 protein [Gemmata algarum]
MSTLVSIVCPAYEEADALPHFHAELVRVLDRLGPDYRAEVIYADDGSADGTLGVLRELAAGDPRVGYLSLSRNFGHQAALTAGLEHATGDVVVMMDSDLQHPPAVIPRLLSEWRAGADVVITVREDDPTLSRSKRFNSWAFYRLMRAVSGTEVRPSAADFRLMTRPAVHALLQLRESHRFIRGMVQWVGFSCREVRFVPAARVAGRSKYTFRKQLRLGLDGMFSFSKAPLRALLGLGVWFAALGAACALAAPFASAPGFWLLAAVVQTTGGATLAGLGVVGEYVGRLHEEVKRRPVYLLKETGNLAATAPAGGEPARPPARRAA